ncbi:MAG TPA: ATP-binding protein [Alphaproteobacteria bacterium]|nr:ATP-binding protein [Verrucomicrobiae bacterium]HUA64745.1 ATP-binding protein [Alphaproteobacteria bacterium]
MEPKRRDRLVYALLVVIWLLVVAWQVEEHIRVLSAAKTDLQNRSTEIADTLSAVVHSSSFRGAVLENRIGLVLNELTRTNELIGSAGVLSIALLNTNGEPLVTAGNTNLIPKAALTEGVFWTRDDVTFVNPVWGASVENASNATVVLPPPEEFSNNIPRGERFDRREFNPSNPPTNAEAGGFGPPPPPDEENTNGPRRFDFMERRNSRRPPWLRFMSEEDFKALIARRELHGLVLTMSTENLRATSRNDLWMRAIIVFFAGISAIGVGMAWRNVDLQIRLVRASELNSHLREMNLAAAGLAHETRNPLNIIRGMAQMISRSEELADLKEKSRAIVDETDKVTAQLNEFINYSRPREVRRARVALNGVVAEVVRALNYDIEEKKIRVEAKMDPLYIDADEQLLRQALFNLLLNAIQAVNQGGQIQFAARKESAAAAALEIRDDGPGVPPELRQQIFKPYFTTHQKGTGLGLAIVQQIVLAHGWEIKCLPNEPKGALFRISHLKTVGS